MWWVKRSNVQRMCVVQWWRQHFLGSNNENCHSWWSSCDGFGHFQSSCLTLGTLATNHLYNFCWRNRLKMERDKSFFFCSKKEMCLQKLWGKHQPNIGDIWNDVCGWCLVAAGVNIIIYKTTSKITWNCGRTVEFFWRIVLTASTVMKIQLGSNWIKFPINWSKRNFGCWNDISVHRMQKKERWTIGNMSMLSIQN